MRTSRLAYHRSLGRPIVLRMHPAVLAWASAGAWARAGAGAGALAWAGAGARADR